MSPSNRPKLIDLYRLREELAAALALADENYLIEPSQGLWRQFHTNPAIKQLMTDISEFTFLEPTYEDVLRSRTSEETLNLARWAPPSDNPVDLFRVLTQFPLFKETFIEAAISVPALAAAAPQWDRKQVEALRFAERKIVERELELLTDLLELENADFNSDADLSAADDRVADVLASIGDISPGDLEGDLIQALGLLGVMANLADTEVDTNLATWSATPEPLLLDKLESTQTRFFVIAEGHGVTYAIAQYEALVARVPMMRLATFPPDPDLIAFEEREIKFATAKALTPDQANDLSERLDDDRERYFRTAPDAKQMHELVDQILNSPEDTSIDTVPRRTRLEILQRAAKMYETNQRLLSEELLNPAATGRDDPAEILEVRNPQIPDYPPDDFDPGDGALRTPTPGPDDNLPVTSSSAPHPVTDMPPATNSDMTENHRDETTPTPAEPSRDPLDELTRQIDQEAEELARALEATGEYEKVRPATMTGPAEPHDFTETKVMRTNLSQANAVDEHSIDPWSNASPTTTDAGLSTTDSSVGFY